MRNRKVLALALLSVVLSGCPASQTPIVTPPTVTQQQAEAQAWAKAVDYFGTIEVARHEGNQLALTLSRQNLIPVAVLKTFVKVNEYTIAANKLLQASPNNFTQPIASQVIALSVQILAELNQWNSVASAQPALAVQLTKMETAAKAVGGLQ